MSKNIHPEPTPSSLLRSINLTLPDGPWQIEWWEKAHDMDAINDIHGKRITHDYELTALFDSATSEALVALRNSVPLLSVALAQMEFEHRGHVDSCEGCLALAALTESLNPPDRKGGYND
jgi:hypothetical protein